jgi:hypothetical protein
MGDAPVKAANKRTVSAQRVAVRGGLARGGRHLIQRLQRVR